MNFFGGEQAKPAGPDPVFAGKFDQCTVPVPGADVDVVEYRSSFVIVILRLDLSIAIGSDTLLTTLSKPFERSIAVLSTVHNTQQL